MKKTIHYLILFLALFVATSVKAQTTTTIPATFFGMTQLSTSNTLASTATRFGVGRLWDTPCTWNLINTSNGVFTYGTSCKAQITYITNANARPLFTFGKTPTWLSGGTTADPPSDVDTGNAGLKAMVDSLVSQLASTNPGVHWVFECVNEADLAGEWTGTMAQLIKYCTALRQEAHAKDPSILVLGPSGSNINTSNVKLYSDGNNYAGQTGAASSMDAIAIHPYLQSCGTFCGSTTAMEAAMSKVDALTASGQPLAGLPVYWTELNWGGAPGPSGGTSLNAAFTDAQKGQFLAQEVVISLEHGIDGFYWYAFDSHPDNLPIGFGTMCVGATPATCVPNRAATTFNTMYSWLVGATYSGTSLGCSKSGSGTYTCTLASSPVSGSSAILIFNNTTTETITLPAIYTKTLNWDGSSNTIANNQFVAGPDVVLAITTPGVGCTVTGGD